MSWRGFTSGNIICVPEPLCFIPPPPPKSSQCRPATGLVSAAGFPASLRHQPEGRSHAADYSNMRGEIGFYFASIWTNMPSEWMFTNQEVFEKLQQKKTWWILFHHVELIFRLFHTKKKFGRQYNTYILMQQLKHSLSLDTLYDSGFFGACRIPQGR